VARLTAGGSNSDLRWWFAIVLVVVAGAVVAFAIYTWGWRPSGTAGSAQHARAWVGARAIERTLCATEDSSYRTCHLVTNLRLAPGLWKATYTVRARSNCVAFDLNGFELRSATDYKGITFERC
jgi:hypothetical protein